MTEEKYFLCIAGNIGSGKSSLTRMLSEVYGWKAYYESVDDNPYLEDFYADMKTWAFHLQVYFLSKRFQIHREIADCSVSVVQDRSIYEDAEIFARNLFEIDKMNGRDYDNYRSLFGAMTDFLRPPDLMIYLKSSVDTLMRQIEQRGRSYERSIPRVYLEQLNRLYEAWIAGYRLGRLLVIDTSDIDFVHRPDDLERVIGMIREALNGNGRQESASDSDSIINI
jgi:deoxyadenosine/deoxycytidine kinase